jgi:hypothetical protein
MGKLTKYTHVVSSNKLTCEVTYTVQGKSVDLKVEVLSLDLLSIDTHWGINTICTKLSQIMGMTVTV